MKSVKQRTILILKSKRDSDKKLSKYTAAFDYIDKTLIVLSATSVTRIPARLTKASFALVFSLTTGIIKKLLKVTRKKEEIQ